jgi:DNA-binding transcriptional MerR regulator
LDKETDAFRTISEVAEDLDVPKHVLRFWEIKFPQIRPMKRGGGRRYYRPEDLDLLRGIRHLLHAEGYTIKGVQKILREQGVDLVKRSWRERGSGGARKKSAGAARQAAALEPSVASAARLPRKANGLAAPRPIDRKARLEQIIGELESCRAVLTGVPAAGAAARKPRRMQAGR